MFEPGTDLLHVPTPILSVKLREFAAAGVGVGFKADSTSQNIAPCLAETTVKEGRRTGVYHVSQGGGNKRGDIGILGQKGQALNLSNGG